MLLPGNESSGWAHLPQANRSEAAAGGGSGPEAVVVPLVFGLIFVVGVAGNSVVMLVIGKVQYSGAGGGGGGGGGRRRAGSPTNIFILNLSVADLSFLLFCVPLQATVYSLPQWVFGAALCRFGHYFSSVGMLVSIFTLAAMAVDRYVAVVRSDRSARVRSRRNALVAVLVIWLLALLGSVPVALHQVLTGHHAAPNSTFCWERWTGASKHAYKVSILLLGYLLPLLLISCCYCRVLFHLQRKMKNMSKRSERSKRKTAQTVLLLVAAFAVCWLPHHVIAMWAEFGRFPLTEASFAFRILSHVLSYGNACVNPVLYAFASQNFRLACRQVLPCCSPRPPPAPNPVVRFRADTFSTHSTTNI